MAQCNGNCGSCGGCAHTLLLSDAELHILQSLGQIPFLPIARKAEDAIPVYQEDSLYTKEEYAAVLLLLERKGLISLDYDKPLGGYDGTLYQNYPVHGSMALTARGQQVLDMLEKQGAENE